LITLGIILQFFPSQVVFSFQSFFLSLPLLPLSPLFSVMEMEGRLLLLALALSHDRVSSVSFHTVLDLRTAIPFLSANAVRLRVRPTPEKLMKD
jgi:hypothetical protein